MKKVIYRYFMDYQREEQWLNEQSKKGFQLVKVQFSRYTFVEGSPGEYIYRNELLSGLESNGNKEYLEFLQEGGIEVVDQFVGWVYFRKKTAEGPFELYSDTSSKISYLNRIIYIFGSILLVNLYFFFFNFIIVDGINRWLSYLSLTAVIIMAFPVYTVYKRKKKLQAAQQIFHQ